MNNIPTNRKFKNLVTLIYSPLTGVKLPLESIEDPMFAIKALGDGVAIEPLSSVILSPCNGKVKFIHSNNNVIIVESEEGFDVLIHIGINTRNLQKDVFTRLVQEGNEVNVGQKLISFDIDTLLKLKKSPKTILVINNLNGITSNIKFFNNTMPLVAGKSLLFVVGKEGILEKEEFKEYFEELNSQLIEDVFSEEIIIKNKTGLHARPAAYLTNLIKNFSSTINLKKNDQVANAKSLIEILGLGINFNDKITIVVKGENAQEEFNVIVKAFKNGLGEEIQEDTFTNSEVNNDTANTTNEFHEDKNNVLVSEINQKLVDEIKSQKTNIILNGIIVYPHIVFGKAYVIKDDNFSINETSLLDPEIEYSRLVDAISKLNGVITNYIKEAKAVNNVSQAEIFSAHLEILKDNFLLDTVKKEIKNGKTAEYALRVATDKTCNLLIQTQNALLKERVADVKDIEKSILTILSGKDMRSVKYPENSIIISEDLTPSQITNFSNVKGVLLAKGSSTSHISIMMKNGGIPSMVSLGEEILMVENGTDVILNSKDGIVNINPTKEQIVAIHNDIEKLTRVKEANLAQNKELSITTDGLEIKVLGNVGSLEQAKRAFVMGGEGIGLVRSEFLFMNVPSAPSEDEQYQIYQNICDAMQGKSVIFRTLDVGGDKSIKYFNLPKEENPIMGLRGVRNYYLNKEIFISQIRALLRVKPSGVCKILIPMVSEIHEVINIKKIINDEKLKLGIDAKIEIGIMVEVPSVILLSKQFAKHIDFFSIGTNDLAQYILAMDRGHGILTKNINNLNPALLKAIHSTCVGAKEYNIPVGVCGAMASELICIPLLIGLGVTSLSCGNDLIPDIKALIRNLNYSKCKEVANKSLLLDSPEQVKELVYKEFSEYL